MPSVSFIAPKPDVMLNMNDRRHWSDKAAVAAEWRKATFFHCRSRPMPKITGLATIRFDFGVRSLKVRRDPHNVFPTVKAGIDGIVDAQWIKDDSSWYVRTEEPRFVTDIRPNEYRVTITWEDPE